MTATVYAHALYNAKDTEGCVSNLVEILKKRGHTMLLPEIVSAFRKIEATHVSKKPTLVVAKDGDGSIYKEATEHYREEFSIKGEVEIKVDDTLVGGYVLRTVDKTIDNSYKRSLLDLYRLITA